MAQCHFMNPGWLMKPNVVSLYWLGGWGPPWQAAFLSVHGKPYSSIYFSHHVLSRFHLSPWESVLHSYKVLTFVDLSGAAIILINKPSHTAAFRELHVFIFLLLFCLLCQNRRAVLGGGFLTWGWYVFFLFISQFVLPCVLNNWTAPVLLRHCSKERCMIRFITLSTLSHTQHMHQECN